MTFCKYGNKYYEFDQDKMRLLSFPYGHFYIDENSPEWAEATMHEYEDWHDLYNHTGYCPTKCGYDVSDCWLDPAGQLYQWLAHAVEAQNIIDYIYGKHLDIDDACEYLIDRGWVKLTTSAMRYYYIEDRMYDNMTYDQWETADLWAYYHGVRLFNREEN